MTSPMDRRAFVTGLGAVLAAPRAVDAQQTKKIPRVGVLADQSPNDSPAPPILTLRQGLRDLGYVEGQDIAIEWRWAHGRLERLPELAAELVKLEVDIIVAATVPDVQAAQEATSTIPIVMGFASDPVAYGLVASLARPGGNVTGIAEQYADLAPKWLELLGGVVPQVSRVGVLVTAPFWPTEGPYWAALQQAAKTMRVTLHRVEVREPSAFENAFAAMTQEHVQALMVLPHPLVFRHRTAWSPLLLSVTCLRSGGPSENVWTLAGSWRMGQACVTCTGAPLISWTESSKARSPATSQSSNRRSSSWSST
jgi:ABC-type uncharacterized transport system substrate-binding protein